MEQSFLTTVGLPLAIIIIMITMGMSLSLADFRRVLSQPKVIGIGLFCQLIFLPILGIILATVLPIEGVFAVSIVLLAATPGGTSSNLIAHVAELDRALSVTLTAISNLLSWLTIPLMLGFAIRRFGAINETGTGEAIDFPVADVMIQVAALTVVPIIIGMAIRHFKPKFAESSKNASKIFSGVFFLLIVTSLVISTWSSIQTEAPKFTLAFILLNIIALAAGYIISKVFQLSQKQATTIAFETGLQNSTLAITIALTVLNNTEMSIIPALYGVWMLITGLVFAFVFNRTSQNSSSSS